MSLPTTRTGYINLLFVITLYLKYKIYNQDINSNFIQNFQKDDDI